MFALPPLNPLLADVNEKKRSVSKGCWDSIHVVEVKEPSQGMASYKLTTTVMLSLIVPQAGAGDVNLAGGLTRQASKSCKLDKFNTHIVNMGKMVEEMEINLRKSLDELYIQRTRMIVNSIRKPYSGSAGPSKTFLADLSSAVGKKGLIENRKKN